MTVEEYRQRMIDAFHNADCDELIALVVMPTEKEFEQLEGLLKTHYKKQPCEDAVSRESVLEVVNNPLNIKLDKIIEKLPSVTPKQRTGKWEKANDSWLVCSECGFAYNSDEYSVFAYCPCCGAEIKGESEWQ